jgi:hypothetical protein
MSILTLISQSISMLIFNVDFNADYVDFYSHFDFDSDFYVNFDSDPPHNNQIKKSCFFQKNIVV